MGHHPYGLTWYHYDSALPTLGIGNYCRFNFYSLLIFMFKSIKGTRKGFTLIELLVVIAIIGILSSVVLASLSTARQKSRDAKRISDIGQVQLALELYFDKVQSYPSTTPAICGPTGVTGCIGTQNGINGVDAAIVGLADVAQKFLPKNPIPAGGATNAVSYYYRGVYDNAGVTTECTAAPTTCTSYFLGANLERSDASVLATDADAILPANVFGTSASCGVTGGTAELCYDIRP